MNLVPAPNGYKCLEDPGEPGLGEQRWSVGDVEGRILSELFRDLTVLEIGTGLGVSTKAIASKAKCVYTVDIDPWVKETVAPGLPENVTFFDDIRNVQWDTCFEAAFIDGLHSYKQCVKDIEDARRLVKPGGLIIFHDATMQAVMKAIMNLHPILINTQAGLAITWNDKE